MPRQQSNISRKEVEICEEKEMARKIADHTWKMSLPKYVSRKEFSTRLKRWAHNSRDTSASKNCAKVSTFSMYGNFSESGK